MQVLEITLPIFSIMLFGFFAGKTNIIPPVSAKILSLYVFYFAIPSLLFLLISGVSVENIFNFSYIGAYLLSLIIISFLIFVIYKIFFPASLSIMFLRMMGASFINSSYLGIPLLMSALGDATPSILISMLQLGFLTPFILGVLEMEKNENAKISEILKKVPLMLIKNPIIVAVFLGIIFAVLGLKLPLIIDKIIKTMGSGATSVALFSIGLALSDRTVRTTKKDIPEIGGIIFAKMIIQPIIAYFIGKYVFNLETYWLDALVLVSAMPTAINCFIFSQKFSIFIKESTAIVLLTTSVAFFTITSLLYFLLAN